MAIKFSLHSIHHTDPKTGEPTIQAPGAVFEVSDEDVDFLENVGAVRDPDDRELTCYRHAIGALVDAPAAAPDPAPAPAPAGKAKGGDEDNIG